MKRFWDKVDVRGPDECWEWKASVGTTGYGQIHHQRRTRKSHQMAFELSNGVPATDMVLHSCDNRLCCNPAHLRDGSHVENMADMNGRGRWNAGPPCGERNPSAKLTADQVRDIRANLVLCKVTFAEMARRYQVDPALIRRIHRREIWR